DSGEVLDSALVENAVAVFEGKVKDTYMSRLAVGGKKVMFVVEGGDLLINWGTGKATGGELNTRLNELDSLMETAETEEQLSDMFKKAYENNKDNGIGPWAFNYYLMYNNFTVAQVDSLLTEAPKNYRELTRVKKYIDQTKNKDLTAEGKPFTDFAVKCFDKKTRHLSDYVGKGEWVIADFWASWCGPCRQEITSTLKPLYEKYGEKVTFLGIAVWDEPEDTFNAIQDLEIPWEVIIGDRKIDEPTNIYGILGIPHLILFDPTGKIVSRGLQGEAFVEVVEKNVNETVKSNIRRNGTRAVDNGKRNIH
ncbi:MAG: redoxin domain-containing protein, partial [Muribaculaceae bacterium]|nr:redoxin domain-containing protein [Muribaculaceae bacterium]